VARRALRPPPIFATVLILSLTVIGVFSFTLLGVDRYPKVTFRRSSSRRAAGRRA